MTAGAINVIKNNSNITFCMNPQITFFKSVYRKYTKFVRTETQTNAISLGTAPTEISILIANNGNLLANISLGIKTTSPLSPRNGSNIENDIGTKIFKQAVLKLKNYQIEKLTSKYINMLARLNNPISTNSTYQIDNQTISCANGNRYQNMSLCGGVINKGDSGIFSASRSEPNCSYTNFNMIIPLPFSFSKDTGSAIPVFLFYEDPTDIKLDVLIDGNWLKSDKSICINTDIPKIALSAICTWYDISEYEQRRFKSSEQEYLVEEIKDISNPIDTFTFNIRSVFSNAPIKGLYLVCNGTFADKETLHYNNIKYKLKIGGVGLFNSYLPHTFFSKKNIYEYFVGCNYAETLTKFNTTKIEGNVAFIPFCLKMSDGPSGSINSRNALDLEIGLDSDGNDKINIDLYIIYYNILKISSGKSVKYVYTGY